MSIQSEIAIKLMNSLRSGTAPLFHTEHILAGRKSELHTLESTLPLIETGTGSVKFVLGDYGVGKSFLINAFREKALKNDYIIASFQINNGFRLNKLEDLYYAIMHNLYLKETPDTKSSFDDIFNLWLHNLQNAPYSDRKRYEVNTVCQELAKYNSNFARAFLSFMRGRIQRNQEMIQVSSAWLTGERNIATDLKTKYGLVGSVDKTNTLDFLKAFIRLIKLLDYKGLLVFIDEIDLELNERSDIRQIAYSNLKNLIDLATSGDMENVYFVFSGTKEILHNKEKGILSYEPLAQRLNLNTQNFSPEQVQGSDHFILLDPLEDEHLLEFTAKVMALYQVNALLPDKLDTASVYAHVQNQIKELNTADLLNDVNSLNAADLLNVADDPLNAPDSHKKKPVTRHYVTRLIEYLDTQKVTR